MASFRFRSNRWQARVRRQGHPDLTKSFNQRIDAERWARSVETDFDRGAYLDQRENMRLTVRDLLARYVTEVIAGNPHEKLHTFRFEAMAKRDIGRLNLTALTPLAVASYRDKRLLEATPGTGIRELACLSAIVNHARREWGITVTNPVPLVRKPTAPKG